MTFGGVGHLLSMPLRLGQWRWRPPTRAPLSNSKAGPLPVSVHPSAACQCHAVSDCQWQCLPVSESEVTFGRAAGAIIGPPALPVPVAVSQ